MDWTNIATQAVKSIPMPAVALAGLYWFREEINGVLRSIAYLIRERKFKGTLGPATVEAGEAVQQELYKIEERIEASPTPPVKQAKIEDLIEAKRFILRDDSGRARAELALTGKEGARYPTFRLFGSSGEQRLTLFASDDGSAAIMAGHPAKDLLLLSIGAENEPVLLLGRSLKGPKVVLTADTLSMSDGRVLIHAFESGASMIQLQDSDGRRSFVP
jgi:hypothetical protein